MKNGENSIKDKILDAVQVRMLQFGYRKVTMDEVASDLKISKNTIYKYFDSKEEIAKELFLRLKKFIEKKQDEIENEFSGPLKIISNTVIFIQKELQPWFSPFMSDIELELPDVWGDFLKFRTRQIMHLESLIKSAINKGEFRSINPALALQVYLGAVDKVLDPKTLEREGLTFSDAIKTVMDIWSKGVTAV